MVSNQFKEIVNRHIEKSVKSTVHNVINCTCLSDDKYDKIVHMDIIHNRTLRELKYRFTRDIQDIEWAIGSVLMDDFISLEIKGNKLESNLIPITNFDFVVDWDKYYKRNDSRTRNIRAISKIMEVVNDDFHLMCLVRNDLKSLYFGYDIKIPSDTLINIVSNYLPNPKVIKVYENEGIDVDVSNLTD